MAKSGIALWTVAVLVAAACGSAGADPTSTTVTSTGATQAPIDSVAPPSSVTTTEPVSTPPPQTQPPAQPLLLADWARRGISAFDPTSLGLVGPALPVGYYVEAVARGAGTVAFTTWADDSARARWRLVVADLNTGEVYHDDRVGDMNTLGMWIEQSGEVLVVEHRRSEDPNRVSGITVHGFDPTTGEVEQRAEFADPSFWPVGMEKLEGSTLGLWGYSQDDGGANRLRIVVFDWKDNAVVVDSLLRDVDVDPDAPDEAFVGPLAHAVVWDMERERALVVHAHEDVVTEVAIPSGEATTIELQRSRSFLEALMGWWVPTAHAKGLPGSQRSAAVIGDTMFVTATSTSFGYVGDELHWFRDPMGLLAINLETLEIVGELDEPIGFVASSPGGDFLVAGGATEQGLVGEFIATTSDARSQLMVIEPDTLEFNTVSGIELGTRHEVAVPPSGDRIYVWSYGSRTATVIDVTTLSATSARLDGGWDWFMIEAGLRYIDYAAD